MVQQLKTIEGLRCCLAAWRQPIGEGDDSAIASVGLVPTMGALHGGHLSLIRRARQENDRVVVSIFINPLQFGPQEDLAQYPRPLEQDLAQCAAAGVDAVFLPSPAVLYGSDQPDAQQLTQVIPPPALTQHLCGAHRPGHFQGVTTVVTKLLNLVQPQRAYFGQKDAQQLVILQRLVADLNLPVAVVGCPIVRETDGLALSSRNQYLSAQQRQQALTLYQGLQAAKEAFDQGERRAATLVGIVQTTLAHQPALQPQYVELVHPHTLQPLEVIQTAGLLAIAAHVGTTRLIDNLLLQSRQPIIAIDGPAGAGKSTVARLVADDLELLYLDSGAMYRAVTWRVLQAAVDPTDEVAVAELLGNCDIQLAAGDRLPTGQPGPSRVWVNGEEVTQAIRTAEVTAHVSTIAAQPMVRQVLLQTAAAVWTRGRRCHGRARYWHPCFPPGRVEGVSHRLGAGASPATTAGSGGSKPAHRQFGEVGKGHRRSRSSGQHPPGSPAAQGGGCHRTGDRWPHHRPSGGQNCQPVPATAQQLIARNSREHGLHPRRDAVNGAGFRARVFIQTTGTVYR
jgi:pantoate ligase/cytidylate kinase